MRLYAYIDPGTGSIIVQAIIGAVVGVTYFVRKHIRVLITRIRQKFTKKDE